MKTTVKPEKKKQIKMVRLSVEQAEQMMVRRKSSSNSSVGTSNNNGSQKKHQEKREEQKGMNPAVDLVHSTSLVNDADTTLATFFDSQQCFDSHHSTHKICQCKQIAHNEGVKIENQQQNTGYSQQQNRLTDLEDGGEHDGWWKLFPASKFQWNQYLTVRAGQRALNGHLFQHQHFVERTLGEHIFRPGRLVQVRHQLEDGQPEQLLKGRVIVTIKGEVFVDINSAAVPVMAKAITATEPLPWHTAATQKKEEKQRMVSAATKTPPYKDVFPIGELELIGERPGKFEGAEMLMEEEWISIDKEYMDLVNQSIVASQQHQEELLSRPLHTFIKDGQFFELNDATNVLNVHVVKVASHGHGMVLADNGCGRMEWTHIGNERCHPMGWTIRQNIKFGDAAKYTLFNTFGNVPSNFVPDWLFTYQPLQEHHFERGMLLEMVDPGSRQTLIPAYISEIMNRHYFKVRPIRHIQTVDSVENSTVEEEYICHRGSPDLLPLGWCFKNQIRLTFPEGMNGPLDSNYSSLRQRLKDSLRKQKGNMAAEGIGPSFTFSFAPDSLFNLPKMMQKKLECIRYCEVQNQQTPLTFHPAAIVRSHRHLVWVHFTKSAQERHSLSCIYSINSLELFRIGSAASFPGFHILSDAIQIPSRLAAERQQLEKKYSSDKTSHFMPTEKAFLPHMWLTGDLWLPPIHLNIACFSGPFLSEERLRRLCYHFGPGALPHMINQLLKEIILCANRPQELVGMLGVGSTEKVSHAQQMMVKVKQGERRIRLTIEVCEKASQFPGWLAMLLIRLDACPNLFSFEKMDECPLNCAQTMASLPYMKSNGHPQTASPKSSQWHYTKLQQDAKQLNREMGSKQRMEEGKEPRKKAGRKKKNMHISSSTDNKDGQRRIIKTRALTVAKSFSIAQLTVRRKKTIGKEGEKGGETCGKKKSSSGGQPTDPDQEVSQESQCSTTTSATTLSQLSAEGQETEMAPSSSSSTETEPIAAQPAPHLVADTSICSNYSKLEKLMRAKLPIVRPMGKQTSRPNILMEKKTRNMGLKVSPPQTSTPIQLEQEGRESQQEPAKWSNKRSITPMPYHRSHQKTPQTSTPHHQIQNAQHTLMEKRVGMVPPYYIHQGGQSPTIQHQSQHHYMMPQPFYAATGNAAATRYPHFQHQQQFYGASGVPMHISHAQYWPQYQQIVAHSMSGGPSSSSNQQQQFGGVYMAGMHHTYPPIHSNPAGWTREELAQWITQAGLEETAKKLKEEDVDGGSIILFDLNMFMNQLKLKMGPALKINHLAETLKSASNSYNYTAGNANSRPASRIMMGSGGKEMQQKKGHSL